jgi:WD40 repeat protein
MDQTLKLWDVGAARAGEARRELLRQPSGVTALSYAGGGPGLLVTGHANRVLRVLDASSLRLVATLRGPEGAVSLVCPVPGGRRLVVASQDRTLRFFDLASRSQLFTMPGHRKPTTSLAFFPDGSHIATVGQDNAVHLLDLEARSLVAALWGLAEESFAGVALFGAGDHVAVALSDGRVRVWGPAS